MNFIKHLILTLVWFSTSVVYCLGIVGWVILQPLMLLGSLLWSLRIPRNKY